MAGTQTLDHEWSLLKEELPKTGLTAKSENGRARMEQYIRAAQWFRLVGPDDRWPRFCDAVRRFIEKEKEKQKRKEKEKEKQKEKKEKERNALRDKLWHGAKN